MNWYYLPPLCGLLGVAGVGWFLMRCSRALDAEARKVENYGRGGR